MRCVTFADSADYASEEIVVVPYSSMEHEEIVVVPYSSMEHDMDFLEKMIKAS